MPSLLSQHIWTWCNVILTTDGAHRPPFLKFMCANNLLERRDFFYQHGLSSFVSLYTRLALWPYGMCYVLESPRNVDQFKPTWKKAFLVFLDESTNSAFDPTRSLFQAPAALDASRWMSYHYMSDTKSTERSKQVCVYVRKQIDRSVPRQRLTECLLHSLKSI